MLQATVSNVCAILYSPVGSVNREKIREKIWDQGSVKTFITKSRSLLTVSRDVSIFLKALHSFLNPVSILSFQGLQLKRN